MKNNIIFIDFKNKKIELNQSDKQIKIDNIIESIKRINKLMKELKK